MGEQSQVNTALTITTPSKLNNSGQMLAIRQHVEFSLTDVPHLGIDEIRGLMTAAYQGRHKERDKLLISFLFDSALRVGECLSVRTMDIKETGSGWAVYAVQEKLRPELKGTRTWVAISPSMAAALRAYAYDNNIPKDRPLFNINRSRVFQIITLAMNKAGIQKPAHVGSVHILRHSGAIERLRQNKNPKATQNQLRHKTIGMTLRYLQTLSSEESLKVNQAIDFQW